MQQKVLVIEDDADVCTVLERILDRHDFEVLTANNALAGLRMAFQHQPEAIILDVVLPEIDGFETCRRLREMTDTPILFLTGQRTSSADIVKGLELGADDYMTKPFNATELVTRLRVCMRRSGASGGKESQYLFPTPTIVLDCGRHELTIDGQTVYLSPSEFEVLEFLVRHADHTLSSNAILAQVWGPEHVGDTRLVKQYIYQLRRKIEPDPADPTYIHTIRGEGYYFAASQRP
jgi:two-component system KDP operon response regulator KdpE